MSQRDNAWERYVRDYRDERSAQRCLAEDTRRQVVMQRGLHPDTAVPLAISCPCPKCSPWRMG